MRLARLQLLRQFGRQSRTFSSPSLEEQRRRCDLQMREVPSNIQEFVQRYEAASPRQLTLRLPELVRIARGIDPGET